MATSSVDWGTDIAITDGGGAAQVTVDVINAMWQNAQHRDGDGVERVDQAISLADPAPQLTPVDLDDSYLPPTPPTLPPEDPNHGENIYNEQRDYLRAMIEDNFRSFIAEFFPDPAFFQSAYDWCERAIVDGGTGINAGVESALWERDRARIMADSERAEDEAMATWANRRFPVPPGALTNQINQVRLDASRKLAESSRTTAIKSFDAEIENVRFAVKTVIDQRKVALDSAGDYIRTLIMGPKVAEELAVGLSSIRNQTAQALVAMYSAQVTALEPKVRLAITDANLQLEAKKANLAATSASIDAKVRAALAGANMSASMASAGINAINGQSSISGVDSSQV